uniref:Uncharacterized protein n=1 Tax=Ciona savignyi TaxID=51511 RepID=H2Y7R9_CIOSA
GVQTKPLERSERVEGFRHRLDLQEPSSQSPLVLFTSTNLTVTSHVFYSCLFRTGVSDVTQSDSIYSNYNFVDYKSRKKRSNKPFSQIYQPVPFRVFPAASGLQAVGDTSRKISSEIGFWDDSAAFGEEGNSIIAPLCGRLDDLRPPALSAGDETADVNTTALTSFKKSIYDRIYSGQLTIMRSPDRDFFSIPRR